MKSGATNFKEGASNFGEKVKTGATNLKEKSAVFGGKLADGAKDTYTKMNPAIKDYSEKAKEGMKSIGSSIWGVSSWSNPSSSLHCQIIRRKKRSQKKKRKKIPLVIPKVNQ